MSKPLPRRLQRAIPTLRIAITGSSRGIGREIARLLLTHGATVIINGRSQATLESAAATLSREFPHGNLSFCVADVSTFEGAHLLADHIRERWGGLDLLINNAGLSMRGPIERLGPETVNAMITGNLLTAIYTTRAMIPMLSESKGHATFVSTVGAIHGFPGISAYAAAKGALPPFVESLNAELNHRGVSAGIIFLGFVENDLEKEIFNAEGKRFHHDRRASVSQDAAARQIVSATVARSRRRIAIPLGRLLDIAHRLVPQVVTAILARSGGRIHSVGGDE